MLNCLLSPQDHLGSEHLRGHQRPPLPLHRGHLGAAVQALRVRRGGNEERRGRVPGQAVPHQAGPAVAAAAGRALVTVAAHEDNGSHG